MSVSGAGARRKGHDFERDIANVLKPVFGPGVRRGLQYQDGSHVPDIVGTPFHIECKRGRKTNIRAAMAQAKRDQEARGGRLTLDPDTGHTFNSPVPVVITKDDNATPLVTMELSDWIQLVAELKGAAEVLNNAALSAAPVGGTA